MSDKSGSSKASKPRRKISLPWFRQSSFSPHSALTRQHTIDVPGTGKYRSFDRSASQVVILRILKNGNFVIK